jgi:hypothetical protein
MIKRKEIKKLTDMIRYKQDKGTEGWIMKYQKMKILMLKIGGRK